MIIDYYLPPDTFTNEDLQRVFKKMEASVVEEKIGVRERRLAGPDMTSVDLAFEAAKQVLEKTDNGSVDFILFCTQSPDYFLPPGACILQNRLGLMTGSGALDFNLGCSGYVYGLAMAKGLLTSGVAKGVLLLTAETYSKFIHPKDRANRAIFGDAASATIIRPEDLARIHEFVLGTDGSGSGNLIVTNGGLRNKPDPSIPESLDENGNLFSPNHLYMNGQEIFNFTIEKVPGLVAGTLEKNGMTMESVDYFVFHQANRYMLEYLRKKCRIPPEKFHNEALMTGNTVSSTIPIALKNAIDAGHVGAGSRVMLAGFGVGYSWGATIIEL